MSNVVLLFVLNFTSSYVSSSFIDVFCVCRAENYLGTKVKNAVVTVPAYFNDSQRQVHI